jgi:hypothetical protein
MYDEKEGFYFIDLNVIYYNDEDKEKGVAINYDFFNSRVVRPIMNDQITKWKKEEYITVYEKIIRAI